MTKIIKAEGSRITDARIKIIKGAWFMDARLKDGE